MILYDWLKQEDFTLALSSGFFGFFAHCGLVSVLEEEGLIPVQLAGSSAGAIVGGCWAAGLSSQDMKEELFALRRQNFWDPGVGLGFLRGKLFRQKLGNILPIHQIENCNIPISISIYDVYAFATRAIKSGCLTSSIYASCAVPGMFQPAWFEFRPYLDGGVMDHSGLHGISKGTRVLYHHLASRILPVNDRYRYFPSSPRRTNMQTVVMKDLPRVTPFRLEQGPKAYEAARIRMKKALAAEILPSSTLLIQ